MQLTERQAQVVHLGEEEGLSWSAIGEKLRISKSTANSSYRGVVARRNAKPKAHGKTCEVKKPD